MTEIVDSRLIIDGLSQFPGLFRNGFLFAKSELIDKASGDVVAAFESRFKSRSVGPYTLLYHPDTLVREYDCGNSHAIVIGDIYDNSGGNLDEVLQDLVRSNGSFLSLGAADLGGRYAIIFWNSAGFKVVNDPFGARGVCYPAFGIPVIASHAILLAYFINSRKGDKLKSYISSEGFAKRTVKYLPGNITPWYRVRRLPPNHIFCSRYKSIARYWPLGNLEIKQRSYLWDCLDQANDALTSYVEKTYDPILGLTGGIDTRMVISAFLHNKVSFDAITWVNFNFKKEEREVVKQIIDQYDISQFDARCIRSDKNRLLERCSGLAVGNGNENAPRGLILQDALLKIPSYSKKKVFIIGYGGEIIRGFYALKGRENSYELLTDEMVSLYGIRSYSDDDIQFAKYWFKDFREKAHQDAMSLKGYPAHDIFYWEHRMGMWASGTLDSIDPVVHALVGINSRRVYEAALSMPEEARLSKTIQIDYIKSKLPKLGGLPVI